MVRAFALKHPKKFTQDDINVLLRGDKEKGTQGIFTLLEEQIKTLCGDKHDSGKHKHKTSSARTPEKGGTHNKKIEGINTNAKKFTKCTECNSTEHKKYWHKDGKFLCPKMKGQTPR